MKFSVGFVQKNDPEFKDKAKFEKSWLIQNCLDIKGKTDLELQRLIFRAWMNMKVALCEIEITKEKPERVSQMFCK